MVAEVLDNPRTQRLPNHHAEDIGAMLVVESGFKVVTRTIGVPQ